MRHWINIAGAAEFLGLVVRVLDGDTIEVLHNNHAERVSLSFSVDTLG